MESELHLKDFVRSGMLNDRLRSGRTTGINQEKINDFLQTHPRPSVRSVVEVSSISQTTIYRIMIEYLLPKPYKAQFVQQLYEEDRVKCCYHY